MLKYFLLSQLNVQRRITKPFVYIYSVEKCNVYIGSVALTKAAGNVNFISANDLSLGLNYVLGYSSSTH